MATPRFLFTTRVLPPADGRPAGVAWRLVGGNNHELGRSHAAFGDYAACVDAVHLLRVAVDRLDLDIEILAAPAAGQWGWQLTVDGTPVAVSCRWYRRDREADANLAQFLAAVPDAGIADVVGEQPPRRELLRPEFVLPHLEPVDPIGDLTSMEDPALRQDQPIDTVHELADNLTEAS